MLLAAAATFAGATVQSATGFGFALVLSPALFAVLDPVEAVTTLLVLGAVLNVLVLAEGSGAVRWRALAAPLAAAVPGLALGMALLLALSKPALQVAVGLSVLAAVVTQWRMARSRAERPVSDGRLPGALATGLTSGVLTTSVSVSGPPLVLWLRLRGLSPAELRASLAAAFLFLNFAGAVVLLAAGDAGESLDPTVIAPLLALALAGHLLGTFGFHRLTAERHAAILLALVAAAGCASVAAGLAT